MPLVKAYDEVENPRLQRDLPNGHFAWRTDFIKRPEDKSIDTPMAFLAEGSAHRVLRVHFHQVDQFQVMYNGSGSLGKHPVGPGAVHFSRAYTPYGPISYSEKGLGFITLRAHRDPGAQYLPENRPVLDSVTERTPWQVTAFPDFDIVPGEHGVAMKALEALKGHDGLAGFSVKMNAGAKAYAPDPSKGDGQYIVVMKGGIVHEGTLKKDLTIVWVGRSEGPFELVAGPEGMEGLILNFPVPGGGVPEEVKPVPADDQGEYKTWQCILCAFVYDEAAGLPEDGIPPGTRWKDVPENWGCPDCSAKKADFEMIEF
jgi:rubredoxin